MASTDAEASTAVRPRISASLRGPGRAGRSRHAQVTSRWSSGGRAPCWASSTLLSNRASRPVCAPPPPPPPPNVCGVLVLQVTPCGSQVYVGNGLGLPGLELGWGPGFWPFWPLLFFLCLAFRRFGG